MTYTLIPGKPDTASEAETMSMIRDLLTEQEQPATAAPARPPQAPVPHAPVSVPQAPMLAKPGRAAFAALHDEPPPRPDRARGPRPGIRHLAIASTLLLAVLRPHWVLLPILATAVLALGAFISLGADRIWAHVHAHLNRIAAKDPVRASALRQRLDTLAYRWDSILDCFPQAMTGRLYMPDFQSMAQADAQHLAAVTRRLTQMQHQE